MKGYTDMLWKDASRNMRKKYPSAWKLHSRFYGARKAKKILLKLDKTLDNMIFNSTKLSWEDARTLTLDPTERAITKTYRYGLLYGGGLQNIDKSISGIEGKAIMVDDV